ncbi:heparan sulfate 2-O-sulfotransferase 1-like isoform X2 [Penaeus chinensis]|uniref:heparan sulfate 2-O-sulfotransferase 1-like isoform X2 n=1 Tax=Penaeus chinensis TaxID=139456 RepID=UPI001FB7E4B7|nr:heparan sulfate 2-O-sulfotransferase 1-like isoform X2 [Penaeus chinensis]
MIISRRTLLPSLCFVTGRSARKFYGVLLVIALSTSFYSLYLEGITHKLVERRSSPPTQKGKSVPEVEITPTARNVTPEHTRLLIYNRVPKCGSTTTFKILNTLRKLNKFRHRNSEIYHTEWLTVEERTRLLQGLYKFTSKYPRSFDRHLFYFNATRSLKQKKRPPESWFNMQLDECAATGHPECRPSPGDNMTLQLTFFCGHHPTCRQVGSRWALNQAKYHLENYYSVVGVLEELSLSLQVLQHYLPRFFNNVGALELGSGHVVLNERPREYKPTVTNATKGMLRSIFKEDLELYQFARQRLHLQARVLGILDQLGS